MVNKKLRLKSGVFSGIKLIFVAYLNDQKVSKFNCEST